MSFSEICAEAAVSKRQYSAWANDLEGFTSWIQAQVRQHVRGRLHELRILQLRLALAGDLRAINQVLSALDSPLEPTDSRELFDPRQMVE